MRLLESRRGLSFFAFEHSEDYQQTQHRFTAAVDSMEPSNIVVRGPHSPRPATAAPPGDRPLLPGAWETPGPWDPSSRFESRQGPGLTTPGHTFLKV